MIVIVRRVRGVPIAPGCGRLLHRNHRSAVRRFARAAAPAIEHHPVQPIAVRAAATRPPRSQVGLDDLPQHDSVFFSVRGNRFDVIGLAGAIETPPQPNMPAINKLIAAVLKGHPITSVRFSTLPDELHAVRKTRDGKVTLQLGKTTIPAEVWMAKQTRRFRNFSPGAEPSEKVCVLAFTLSCTRPEQDAAAGAVRANV